MTGPAGAVIVDATASYGENMKVVVAMSGGVDSSVAAALLHNEGHKVVGIHMKLHVGNSGFEEQKNSKVCCSLDDVNDCRLVADKLGIPFYVLNMTEQFQKKVVDYFVSSYKMGMTPSPCTMCNGEIKFQLLVERAKMIGCDYIATGHYAKIENNRLYASASEKDQSYFLFNIKKELLPFVRFPIESMAKSSVRAIAEDLGLITAKKRESMEICFVDSGHHSDFVSNHLNNEEDFSASLVDEDGLKLGVVDRYFRFTIGQRRGLPVSGYYIKDINAESRIITLSREKAKTTSLELCRTNWHEDISLIGEDRTLFARTRHKGVLLPAKLDGETVVLESEAIKPARGQVVVIYDNNSLVVGGGYVK